MLNHKSEGRPRHSTMQTFTTPCVPHPVCWYWWNLNGRNPEFANYGAWRWSKAASTLFPDSPSNDSCLKASKARNHSCDGCQWACFTFLCSQIVAVEYCEAVSSATGGWEDVVSTWIACSSEERPAAKVGSSDSLGSEVVSYSNTGDTFRVLASFFRSFLAFVSSRRGEKWFNCNESKNRHVKPPSGYACLHSVNKPLMAFSGFAHPLYLYLTWTPL